MAQKKDMEYLLSQARRIAEHREAGAEKEIRKLYKSMLKDLKGFVADTYEKYAEDGSLTYAMLQKASYDARFLEEVEKQIGIATPKAARELRELVQETYEIAYDGMVEAVLKGGDLDEAFAGNISITPQQIKNTVKNPIMEVALEKNHKDIIYDIKQVVAVGLMNGDRYSTMAQRISEKVDGAYYKSVRIARTESHRVIEAGNHDAALEVDTALQRGSTGLRMTKTWKSMKDERVRPQQKIGKKIKMRGNANHMKMDGQTVLADEKFDLGHGITAAAPGQSGDAANDINCRCYASYEMMTDDEYFAATGKHFPGWKPDNATDNGALTRDEMRQRIADDKKQVSNLQSSLRDVDLDIAEHSRTDFDDLKGLKKSDISGGIKEIEDRENVVNPLVDRYYNRPARGTPEYDDWRKWKQTIDSSALIDEQMQLAKEKAVLNSRMRRYDRYEKWQQWKNDNPLAELQKQRTEFVREIKRLKDEIKDLEDILASDPLMTLVDMLEDKGVIRKAVNKHAQALSESEIIAALAGGDLTKGSCASVGLAYMGQRGGLNVLDFRGGTSCDFFATTANLREIAKLPGVKTIRQTARSSTTAGNKLLKQVEIGKEYYLVSGRHASIVRKTEDGALQYLELQSATHSGWHNFDGNPRYTLKTRFGEYSGFDVESFMIEVDSFKDSADLHKLLEYINTADDKQKKGVYGTIK